MTVTASQHFSRKLSASCNCHHCGEPFRPVQMRFPVLDFDGWDSHHIKSVCMDCFTPQGVLGTLTSAPRKQILPQATSKSDCQAPLIHLHFPPPTRRPPVLEIALPGGLIWGPKQVILLPTGYPTSANAPLRPSKPVASTSV